MYTALGGSNTCGHGSEPPRKMLFRELIYSALRGQGLVDSLKVSCIPAAPPTMAAACLSQFAPAPTSFATVEYTPNMHDQPSLGLSHLREMLLSLSRRHVRVVVINLVPPTGRYPSLGARVAALAAELRLPSLTLLHSNASWQPDLRHINRVGHAAVASRALRLFLAPPALPPSSPPSPPSSPAPLPLCAVGAELRPLILHSSGWRLADEPTRADASKAGLLAEAAGASLTLCLRGVPPHAAFTAAFLLERSSVRPMSNVSFSCDGCACPPTPYTTGGETIGSHLFVGARRGGGGGHAWVHRLVGRAGPRECCAVALRSGEGRAKLSGVVFGADASVGGWANSYFLSRAQLIRRA
ncbi:hypothetical protein AB1Y20_012335 [Prymnesium parvum]|uniref:Uncharacterized protein n=1 Tax=Prymnesium parvum TaxID=97485 RepID=A0AB34IN88_PRYPA